MDALTFLILTAILTAVRLAITTPALILRPTAYFHYSFILPPLQFAARMTSYFPEKHSYSTSSLSTSLHSHYADSASLVSGTTSAGTILGPGSLSGKAVLALGKLTLKGVERVVISRRLSTISSKFPHSNVSGANIKGLLVMYEDLLELSR